MIRKTFFVALAASMLAGAPVAPTPVEARSLFESLFPRAAERRRQRAWRRQERLRRWRAEDERARRRETKRKRARRAASVPKVTKTVFLNYKARPLAKVGLTGLKKPFLAHHQLRLASLALAAEAATRTARPAGSVSDGHRASGPLPQAEAVLPDDQAQAIEISNETTGSIAGGGALHLSAGADHLASISLRARKPLGKAAVAHYAASPEFLWHDADGSLNEKGEAVLAVLRDADAYGLKSADYALPEIDPTDDALKQAMTREFALTVAALRYLSDARHGVADPNRISTYHDFKNLQAKHAQSIEALAAADDAGAILLAAHPQSREFAMLKDELAALSAPSVGVEPLDIPRRTFIRPGQTNAALAAIVEGIRRKADDELRAKHAEVLALDHSGGVYDKATVALVRDFQRSQGLGADGIIGRKTIAKLIGNDPRVQVEKIELAMERLRWHPDRLGGTRVFINQPAFTATHYRNDRPNLTMRAVVGKKANQTNFFYDTIEYVEFNPYWGVPRSILVNEMLPKLRSNAGYLDRLGYEISDRRGRRISSSNVDWWSVGANFPYDVRQPPGRKNALGELKIMFPNKHSIYMHDTPAKSLFSRSTRAFSHGCVRLHDPHAMAAAVLGTSVPDVKGRIRDGRNKQQKLQRKIPVYVAYFTAWPDQSGKVRFYNDIYDRDAALTKALAAERKAREAARRA